MALADATSTKPASSRPRGSKIFMILGGLLLVLGIVVGQSGTEGATGAFRDISNSGDDVRNSLLLEVDVPGDGDVELERGGYDVFAIEPQAPGFQRTTTTSLPVVTDASGEPDDPYPGYEEPTVEITGPGGARTSLRAPGIEALFTGATGKVVAIQSFTVTEPGLYHLEVSGTGADKVGIGPTVDNGNFGRMVKGGLLGLVGYLTAGLGFVLGLAGLIWFLVAGADRPKAGPGGLYAPVAAGPWPPPATWGQPPRPPGPAGSWGPPPGAWTPPTAPHASKPPPPPPPPSAAPPWGSAPPSSPGPAARASDDPTQRLDRNL